MKRRLYWLIRDLHLFLGLFSSPFVIVFAVSVFFMVHGWLPRSGSSKSTTRTVPALPLPRNVQTLSGRPLIDALKPVLETADVRGEIGFIRHLVKEEELIIPVSIPGRETTVSIKLANGDATILTRELGLAAALATLHQSPGEHAPAIRMNWSYMRAWRWFADSTVYLILFITLSGVYLWLVMRAERGVGFVLIITGALTLFGMAYALSH